MLLALLIAAQTYGPQHLPPVTEAEDPLVDAAAVVRGLIVDLAYAKEDNIAGRALYPPDAKCLCAAASPSGSRSLLTRCGSRGSGWWRAIARVHPSPSGSCGERILRRAPSPILREAACTRAALPSISSLPISPALPSSSRRSSTRSVRMPRP